MLNHQLEAKVLEILERVLKGQTIEDNNVELKSVWVVEHRKTARQVAGHANSAAGQPILWIIGADDKKHTVTGVEHTEYSNWWNQVRTWFSEIEPEPRILNVPYNGISVTGILFETDRAPYVVKADGEQGISREVPYRIVNSTESATRQQLLRILSRDIARPKLELMQGKLAADKPADMGGVGQGFRTMFHGTMIIYQSSSQETFLVSHKSELYVANDQGERWGLGMVKFVKEERSHITLSGAQMFRVIGESKSEGLSFIRGDRGVLTLHMKFWVDSIDDALTVAAKMDPVTGEGHQATWLMKSWRYPW